MSEVHREHLLEEYDDAELKLLMDEEAAAQGEALWRAFEQARQSGSAPQVPKDLDEACRRRIRTSSGRRRTFLRQMGTGMKRAAVIVLVFLCLASTMILSVDALRIPVINFFVKDKDRYQSIVFREEVAIIEEQFTLLEWVVSVPPPDGYELVRENGDLDTSFYLEYRNENDATLQVRFFFTESMISYDLEDTEETSIKINDYEAIFIQKKGHRVFWFDTNNGGVFDVRSESLPEEEFWKYVYRLAD